MASDEWDVIAARSVHIKKGSTSKTDRFLMREAVPHMDVAEYKQLYRNTLDARCIEAMFSDGQKSMVLDRMEVRCDTDIGACNQR